MDHYDDFPPPPSESFVPSQGQPNAFGLLFTYFLDGVAGFFIGIVLWALWAFTIGHQFGFGRHFADHFNLAVCIFAFPACWWLGSPSTLKYFRNFFGVTFQGMHWTAEPKKAGAVLNWLALVWLLLVTPMGMLYLVLLGVIVFIANRSRAAKGGV